MVDKSNTPAPGLVAPLPSDVLKASLTDFTQRVGTRRTYTVRRASDLMAVWGVVFALYGPPGSGKSTLAAQAAHSAHAGRVGVVDVEGGARAYGDHDDIDVFSLSDSDATHDSGMGFKAVEDILDDLISGRLAPEGGGKYGTIIYDNCSEANVYCMYDTLRTVPRKIERNDRPDQHDWNTTTSRMLLHFRRWRDFAQSTGTNVIFVAWDRFQEDKVTGIGKKDMSFNPALASQFPGLLDMVGYLTIDGKGKRRLSFEASASTAAKFRRNPSEIAMSIPSEFQYEFSDPNMPMRDLIDCLKGGIAFPKGRYKIPGVTHADRAAGAEAKLSGADAVAAAIRGQSV